MTDRLTDEPLGHLSENDLKAVEERIEARWRLMQDDYAWGKDVDQQLDILAVPILSAAGRLVAEVREHRATIERVRRALIDEIDYPRPGNQGFVDAIERALDANQ